MLKSEGQEEGGGVRPLVQRCVSVIRGVTALPEDEIGKHIILFCLLNLSHIAIH